MFVSCLSATLIKHHIITLKVIKFKILILYCRIGSLILKILVLYCRIGSLILKILVLYCRIGSLIVDHDIVATENSNGNIIAAVNDLVNGYGNSIKILN
jgi:hypothetical protein